MEQKELKRIGVNIIPLKIIIVLLIIVSLSAASLVIIKNNSAQISGEITNNIQSEGIIPEADAGNIISVPEDEINSSLFTPIAQDIREYCNKTCIMQIGSFNYMQDSDLAWKEFTKVVKFYNSGNNLIAEWNGKKAVIEIGFAMKDGTKVSLTSARAISNFNFETKIYDESKAYKFDLNMSGIAIETASNINGIYIKSNDTKRISNNDLVFDDIRVNFDDAIMSGLIVNIDSNSSLILSNITDTRNIFIDPVLTLVNITNGGTEDVSLTRSGAPVHVVANESFFIKFSISSILSDANILDAKLGLYAAQITGSPQIHGVNCSNQSWTETQTALALTTGTGALNASCKRPSLFTNVAVSVGWNLFSVTSAVNASFVNGDKNTTFLFNMSDIQTGKAWNDNILGLDGMITSEAKFNSSEATGGACGGTSCVPYLQINYSTCNCPAINTDWIISARECTIGNNEICNLGTGKLQVIDNGYLNVHGKMLASKCYFENSSSRYRVWKQTVGLLKCGS